MMQHLHSLDDLHLQNAWVTIGTFDGVHRAHQAIIGRLVTLAHASHAPAVVVTFHPHPVAVLRNIDTPYYLSLPDERAALLGELGIDAVFTLPFDQQMAQLSAEEFMLSLKAHLGIHSLWVGHDFALGRNRSGDIPTLRKLGEQLNYQLEVVPPFVLNEQIISSSSIRAALREGNVELAAELLGRPYSVQGGVIPGEQRGRTIGLPTANLDLPPQRLLPANGVYATWVWLGPHRHAAVTNIGVRPTFEQQPVLPRVEAHLLDYQGDLYSQPLRLEFIAHLRSEQRFENVQALVAQIQLDINRTREVLSHAEPPDLSS